ncbi:MAG: hypothetical protein MRY21_08060 [Simkaniaceae bacterium]|nr:hypothetical protein [Simkaniaceae bacterium]
MKFRLLFLLLVTVVFADRPNNLSVGPVFERTHLKTNGQGNYDGNLWGAELAYTLLVPWGLYARASFDIIDGNLTGPKNGSHIEETDFFIVGRVGGVFNWGHKQQYYLAPYAGYMLQTISRREHITGEQTLTYTYFMPYVPVGFYLFMQPFFAFSIGIDFCYQIGIETYLAISSLKGSRWALSRKNNWRLELPINYRCNQAVNLRFVPYAYSGKIGSSSAVTSTGLPLGIESQSYSTWGMKVALGYNF